MAHNAARMKKRADDARKDAMEKLRMGDPARLPLEHGNFLSLMVQWGAFFHVGDGACRACGSRKSKDGGPAWTDDDFLVRPPGGKLGKVDASALAQLQKIANNPSMSKISQFVLSNVAPEAEEWEDVLSKPPMPEDDVDSVSARKDMHVKDLPELREELGFHAILLFTKLDWMEMAATVGFPTWSDGMRPCPKCNVFGDGIRNHRGASSAAFPFRENEEAFFRYERDN